MKAYLIFLLLASSHWSTFSIAEEFPNTLEKITQDYNKTNAGQNKNTETDVPKKYFLPPITDHDDDSNEDDFYPKPHFPPLLHPFVHHHKPEHYDKPKPPVHKPPPKPVHKPPPPKPPPKPVQKPEHDKPPIVIHHQPIHKPVHIYIHKPSHHSIKPTQKPVHQEQPKPPDHHKIPLYHKPHKGDCDSRCNGTKLDDGGESILLSETDLDEVVVVDKVDSTYATDEDPDQSGHYAQLESADITDKYVINYTGEPTKPNYQNSEVHFPGGSGTRRPIISLADWLSELRPVPWYSQHEEEGEPVNDHHSEESPLPSNPDPDKPPKSHSDQAHNKPCSVHHHYHYHFPVKEPVHHHFEYSHVPNHPPSKPPKTSNYPIASQKENVIVSTESFLAETVDPHITIPYNEYDVSTKATTTEEDTSKEESHTLKPIQKPKPKPSYRPMSQILPQILWPFTPKPISTKVKKKPLSHEHNKKKGEHNGEDDDEEDNFFSDFFDLK